MHIAQDQRHAMDGERTISLSFCDFSILPVSLTVVALLQERDELPIELCGGDQAAEAEVISFMHRGPVFVCLEVRTGSRRLSGGLVN